VIETVRVTRYVTPLREGGSLPGIVEADDLGTYVCKFRGAGQGVRVLAAEVIAAGVARLVGVPTPRVVGLDLDPEIARYEADEEVQDLIAASPGLNLGIDFLPGAFGYDGTLPGSDESVGARVLWLDAFLANVDRTWRNPNLLVWHDQLWAIDHGASLYFHHAWKGWETASKRSFTAARDHVLLPFADAIAETDAALAPRLTQEVLSEIVDLVPEEWLRDELGFVGPATLRAAYVEFLSRRLEEPRGWVWDLEEAHEQTV
jgi:hypothetical protein